MPQLLEHRQTKIGQPWLLQTYFEIQIGDRWQFNPSKEVRKKNGVEQVVEQNISLANG